MPSHFHTKSSSSGYGRPVKAEQPGANLDCKFQSLGGPHAGFVITNKKQIKEPTKKRKDRGNGSDSEDTKPKPVRKKKSSNEEKRQKRFRIKPPLTYLERLNRVTTQRMFLIDRNRATNKDGTHEEEVFDIAGTTGNIYQVTIAKVPRCSCPDSMKGNQCKHIIYVSSIVLV